MLPDSPYDTRLGRESGKLTSAPPKFRGPYAYDHVCNVAASQEDIVKTRINDRSLERSLRAKFNQSSSIWSSFLVVNNTETFYRSSCVLEFNNEDKDNTQQCTSDIMH